MVLNFNNDTNNYPVLLILQLRQNLDYEQCEQCSAFNLRDAMPALFQGEGNDKIHAFYDGGYGFFFVSLANFELHFYFHILK